MKQYSAMVNLSGDRNQVVPKSHLTPPEIMVLMHIHGADAVHSIAEEPGGNDKRSHQEVKEYLQTVYGKTKTGPDDDKRPALVRALPGWPNPKMPTTVDELNLNPMLLADAKAPEPAPSKPEPVKASRNTYWKLEDEGDEGLITIYGYTAKGTNMPEEEVTVMKKADWEKEKAEIEAAQADEDDDDFTE